MAATKPKRLSRRTLLLTGGSAAVALSGGLLAGRSLLGGADPAPSTVVGAFDAAATREVVAPTALANTTVAQSFAFDSERGDLYAVQIVQGGLRLADEPDRVPADERGLLGDLCVTRIPADRTAPTSMYLRGFGHGVSMGVQPTRSGALLWVESDADPKTGYGRAVTRVAFRAGTTLDSGHPSVRHHRPVPGSFANQPVYDAVTRRLMVAYRTGSGTGAQWYAVYRADDFAAGRYDELYAVRAAGRTSDETFQGCALYGDHVYQLTGNEYTDADGDNPAASGGNALLSAVDLRTGKVAGRAPVTAAADLPYREPEGLAVLVTDRPRLCVGFATGAAGGRRFTVHSFAPL
ncbi:signaling protein [Streptomyces sp. NPDC093225]|uniref:phage baseplate protein n=1 Tax=Streptomyces sp. NPDC093225 TaxID=3366034 RepID=UPI0038120932